MYPFKQASVPQVGTLVPANDQHVTSALLITPTQQVQSHEKNVAKKHEIELTGSPKN